MTSPPMREREGVTTIRTLLAYQCERSSPGHHSAMVAADALCHGMVRALVGAVVRRCGRARPVPFALGVLDGGVRDPRVKVISVHDAIKLCRIWHVVSG